jgi:solute:Na+ symporter, SSS family
MRLTAIDWVIAIFAVAICFAPALFFGKRSSKNTSEFFASGRSVPWWLAGLSMVATTFSSDTPNLVTDIVRTNGVAGNWVWWAFVLTGVATVFFYARLWRRSEVLTDLEFYEIRYSGKAASMVRGFRAVYLGLLFNCLIMATVNLAACKIANILFGLERWQTLLFVGLLNVVFAAHSGLWGVLVIDMIQFFIKMTAVIAAAYFAGRRPQRSDRKTFCHERAKRAQLPECAA